MKPPTSLCRGREPLESPRAVHWKIDDGANNRAVVALAARRSSWTSSLPLALENRRLAQAQRPYVDALKAAGKRSGDIIGAVFVINGKVQGAEIYQSHVLFRHMWQKVLRAYATEAISSKDALSGTPPSVDTINAFLADAEGGQLRERTSDSHVLFRDSEAAIYAETQERDGRWVYRSYLSKLDPAAMPLTPDATVVKMLETGQVNGRPINTLADDETVVLDSNASGAGWTATVSSPERSADSTRCRSIPSLISGLTRQVAATATVLPAAAVAQMELVVAGARALGSACNTPSASTDSARHPHDVKAHACKTRWITAITLRGAHLADSHGLRHQEQTDEPASRSSGLTHNTTNQRNRNIASLAVHLHALALFTMANQNYLRTEACGASFAKLLGYDDDFADGFGNE